MFLAFIIKVRELEDSKHSEMTYWFFFALMLLTMNILSREHAYLSEISMKSR